MQRKLKFATALGAALSTAAIAGVASADEDRIYASLMAQYMFLDEARPVGNDFGAHLAVGFPIFDKVALEVSYHTRSFDGTPNGLDQDGYGVDGLFFVDRDGRLDPYVLLGVGEQTSDLGPVSEDYMTVSIGLGVMDAITDNFAFRGDIRAYDGDDAGQSTDIAVGVGLMYLFGEVARQPTPAAAAPLAVERDSDGDGVLDSKDMCPGTAAGASVDGAGCVLAAAVVAPEPDSDGDGVKDSSDRCPNTPAGQAVLANGCPADSDGDGVYDSADQCPGTPAGTRVLANGCPVPTVVKLEGVTFETGSDRITAASKPKLDEAVAALKANPTISVEVAGHTDSVGKAESNRVLSQKRADAVRKYLVDGGVAADQVSAKGYGPDEPVASNDTDEGRAANRRVELRVKQ